MKVISAIIALALAPLFTFAMPASSDITGVSPNLGIFEKRASGLNCQGSFMCPACASTSRMKLIVDQLKDDAEFKSGEQIACMGCDLRKTGTCIFAQKLKKDEVVTGRVVKEKLNRLIKHGCRGCGSCPVHPGNKVDDGMITLNYVENICRPYICRNNAIDEEKAKKFIEEQGSGGVKKEKPDGVQDSAPLVANPFKRNLVEPKGLNCRGSSFCSNCFGIKGLKKHVDKLHNNSEWANGEKIACTNCSDSSGEQGDGLCVFAQNMGDKNVSGEAVKQKVLRLQQHGCGACGSCPVYPGNELKTGMITINYVKNICRDGVCYRGD